MKTLEELKAEFIDKYQVWVDPIFLEEDLNVIIEKAKQEGYYEGINELRF